MKTHRCHWLAACLALLIGPGAAVTPARGETPATPRVYNVNDPAITPPVVLRRDPPDYPAALKAQRATAKVVTEFLIDTKGNVTITTIVSSTDSRFNDACMAAIKKWKFKPALHDGKPVFCRASQMLEFNID